MFIKNIDFGGLQIRPTNTYARGQFDISASCHYYQHPAIMRAHNLNCDNRHYPVSQGLAMLELHSAARM
jgi:hypothetical protein